MRPAGPLARLLAVASGELAGAISLRTLDGSTRIKEALARGGFKDGRTVAVILDADLEELLELAACGCRGASSTCAPCRIARARRAL